MILRYCLKQIKKNGLKFTDIQLVSGERRLRKAANAFESMFDSYMDCEVQASRWLNRSNGTLVLDIRE